MKDRLGPARMLPALAGALLLALACWGGVALAGTTGKLAGRVTDHDKRPIAGANVAIPAYRLGAATDADGRYVVINVPPGACEVRFKMMGHRSVTVQGVEISADNTTRQDAVLQDTTISIAEVVVNATRPVVDVHMTSTMASVSRERIRSMPVQSLDDIVKLQAGVVDDHFRGGRSGEVQYQVDGVSINNPYDNKSTLKLDRSLLEEVQVISGTFDAEYGQAMSGVVNAVLRRGSEKFQFNAEAYTGGFLYSGNGARLVDFKLRPTSSQNFQASLSGPAGLPATFFLVSASRNVFNDYVYATRLFNTTDRADFEKGIYTPTGDGAQSPLGWSREWSGVAKLTNRSIRNVEVSYQAIFNRIVSRPMNYVYRLEPDGYGPKRTTSIVHGLEWTHTLSPTTVYKLTLRQNYFDYKDMLYDDLNDARYDSGGPTRVDPHFIDGVVIEGVDYTRFTQRTNAIVFKGGLTSQFSKEQQVKLGLEFQAPNVQFGSPGFLRTVVKDGVEQLVRYENQPPDFPAIREYHPVEGAAFAQEEVEWNDLRVHAGVRMEYFDARSTVPSDLQNPSDSISGVPHSHPQATTAKVTVAPRVGVSYPVSDRSSLFFAYGHFYQMPGLGKVFDNADYSILARLQAGDPGQFGVFGNPDLRPEKTVQYQVGYKHAINDWVGLDVNMFYKDIRDLLGVEFVKTYTQAEYARYTNVDFGSVIGFTVAVTQRARGLLSTSLDYTWQMARGNSSDPSETLTRQQAGEDPRPRKVPFNWDQRHTLNLSVSLARPRDFSACALVKISSGQPYTPATAAGFGHGLETNSGVKPASMVVDLRAEKTLRLAGLGSSVFGRVYNLFDTRFNNGLVFATSGSPYYSRYPASDQVVLADPTRFYQPRRIEAGLTVSVP